jgi:hypothetical protein
MALVELHVLDQWTQRVPLRINAILSEIHRASAEHAMFGMNQPMFQSHTFSLACSTKASQVSCLRHLCVGIGEATEIHYMTFSCHKV